MNRLRFLLTFVSVFSASCGLHSSVEGLSPSCPRSIDFFTDVRDFADILRNDCTSVSDVLNSPALTAVTKEFGPTIISTKQFPIKSDVAISENKPWSSWWYPKKEDFLFSNSDSTMAKYDAFREKYYRKIGKPRPASAAEYERQNYNSKALPWEGLCDAWALASIIKPEPKHAVKMSVGFSSSVLFGISDLKALLLKTFEGSDDDALTYYGQKFTGNLNGWIYPDIFPEQFHRFLEVQLFEKHQPFIMDHDPGVEVWNVPIFKANYIIENIPDNPNAVLVRTWVFTAEPTLPKEKEAVGTREAVREYNYILQGTRNANGDLVINAGYWIKGKDGVDSRQDHPDYLIRVSDPNKLSRKSWNPEIDVNLIDEILKISY